GALDAHLPLERDAVAQPVLPMRACLRAIFRVQAVPERFLLDVGRIEPAVGEPGLVPVVDLAGGVRRPDAFGHRVQQAAIALLALAFERLALAFAQYALLQLQ